MASNLHFQPSLLSIRPTSLEAHGRLHFLNIRGSRAGSNNKDGKESEKWRALIVGSSLCSHHQLSPGEVWVPGGAGGVGGNPTGRLICTTFDLRLQVDAEPALMTARATPTELQVGP